MRKTERLKKLRQPLPEERKKIDTSINGDAERLIEEQKIVEKHLYPLRIDHRTVIYVPKEKCTLEYAKKKRIQFGAYPVVEVKGHAKRKELNEEDVRKMLKERMTIKDISYEFGVSRSTLGLFVKKHNLRKE